MGNSKAPPLGKGVCERRGPFWKPARRAPAKGWGWKRGFFPPPIFVFPPPLYSVSPLHFCIACACMLRFASTVCAAAASERVATPTADPVPSPKTDTAPTPKSAASAARPVGTPGHFGTQIESSSVDSPSQAAYARMQYLVVLLKEKAPVFDGGVFARQVAMTQGAPENSVIVLDQIGNRCALRRHVCIGEGQGNCRGGRSS